MRLGGLRGRRGGLPWWRRRRGAPDSRDGREARESREGDKKNDVTNLFEPRHLNLRFLWAKPGTAAAENDRL